MFMEFLTSVTRFIHRAMEEREWVWLSSHVPSAGVLHLQKKDQEQIGALPKPVSNTGVHSQETGPTPFLALLLVEKILTVHFSD